MRNRSNSVAECAAREVVAVHRRPVVRGQAPALALGREVVGRSAEGHVGAELIAMRPEVGALAADDERHVPHELDARVLQLRARRAPLLVRDPLEVHLLEDRGAERAVVVRARGEREDLRRAVALVRRPRRPAVAVVRGADGRVERVVLEPAALVRDEGHERGAALGLLRLALAEPGKGGAERGALQAAHGRVIDARRLADAGELREALGAERLLHERLVDLGHRLDGDVDRVERERGERAVRARLAVGELVRGEHLEEVLSGAKEELRACREIRDLADSPVRTGTYGE